MDKTQKKIIESLCKAVSEIAINVDHDLTGEHRQNYNPRIIKVMKCLVILYPVEMCIAMGNAKLF